MDGRAAEREPCGLERPAVRTRQHRSDREPEAAHAASDRAGVGAPLRGEVALRAAIGDDDGILVGLGEVRRRVPEHDDEAAGA